MNHLYRYLLPILLILCSCQSLKTSAETPTYPFEKSNLVPWSIVGFDVKDRSPEERLEMLQKLGYNQYGYGNRPKHIPTMVDEWKLAKQKGIKVKAVWLYLNLTKDRPHYLTPNREAVFENLELAGLKTQIWVGLDPKYFENLSEGESFAAAVKMVSYLAERAEKLSCKIALYNHGGWYGKPENQLKIIKALPQYDLGVVFNFHHAHDRLDDFETNIESLLPYLWCVNLNGMKAGGPKILTIGEGDLEKEMIQKVLDLNYKGPFGILGHVKGGDPEVILAENEAGLYTLFPNGN